MLRTNGSRGFSLVEFAILIAMIAVLVAISTNAGRDAFTRSRVAEERQQLRIIRSAMHSYYAESADYLVHAEYPPDRANEEVSWYHLTTPVAYLSEVPRSNFSFVLSGASLRYQFVYWGGPVEGTFATAGAELRKRFYAVASCGPDGVRQFGNGDLWEFSGQTVTVREGPSFRGKLYDPTNGALSGGDLVASPAQLYN